MDDPSNLDVGFVQKRIDVGRVGQAFGFQVEPVGAEEPGRNPEMGGNRMDGRLISLEID